MSDMCADGWNQSFDKLNGELEIKSNRRCNHDFIHVEIQFPVLRAAADRCRFFIPVAWRPEAVRFSERHAGWSPRVLIYVAGPIELLGGILVMIGLLTHWAAFIASGQMAVAYWMAHGTRALLPIQNEGELAVLYCFVFLFIAAQGGGIWSVDAFRSRRKTHG